MNAVLLDDGLSKGFSTDTFDHTGTVDSFTSPNHPQNPIKTRKNKTKQHVEKLENPKNSSCTIVDAHVSSLPTPSISNSFIYSSSSLPDDKPKSAKSKVERKGRPQRSLKDLPIPHTTPWVVRRL